MFTKLWATLTNLMPFLKDGRKWWKLRKKRKGRTKLEEREDDFARADSAVDELLNKSSE